MAQQKKQGYYLHSPLSSKVTKFLIKAGVIGKKATTKDAVQKFVEERPDLISSLDFFILAEEWNWRRQGREVVFPASPQVLDSLQRAKFNLGQDGLPGIEMPFNSFVLAFPKEYQPAPGVDLNPILVTWEEYGPMVDNIYIPFTQWLGMEEAPEAVIQQHQPGERGLSIITCLNPNTLEYMRTILLESEIPKVLAAQTPEEFKALASDYREGGMMLFLELDEEDLKRQFYAFRLACSMAIFNQATEGAFLKDGFPDNKSPRILAGDPLRKTHHSTLHGTQAAQASPQEHYRSWHFRQLRDARFYRGEHENKPAGSRWVFVSDSTVGAKVTAHTQEVEH